MNNEDNTGSEDLVGYAVGSAKQMLIAAAALTFGGSCFTFELNGISYSSIITAGLGLLIALGAIPYTLTRSLLDDAQDAELRALKQAKLKYAAALAIVALCAAYRLVTAF